MHLFIRKAGFAFPMKHIPIPPDPFPHFRLGNMANSATAGLVHAKRAFEGAIGLLPSKARNPFSPDGSNAVLNVEMFGGDDDSDWPYLLFVHGICESAETWTVQRLAIACKENKCRLAVLELEGHGLSTGKRSVCGSFERLCHSVNSFIQHIISGKDSGISFVICGSSLGGILAAYGADFVMKKRKEPGSPFQKFLGAIPIVPAVGTAPEAVPSAPIVRALSIFAAIAPSTGILTPKEDPSHYACPANTQRNFKGQWPLSTSKMLLDVTSSTVKTDLSQGRLIIDYPLLVIAGEKDRIVPLKSVEEFFCSAQSKNKSMFVIPKGDHGLMVEERTAKIAIQRVFEWIKTELTQ